MLNNNLLLCVSRGGYALPAKSRLGVSAIMTANYYSGAATLTFTVDGVALIWGRIKDENGSRSRSNLTDGRLFFD